MFVTFSNTVIGNDKTLRTQRPPVSVPGTAQATMSLCFSHLLSKWSEHSLLLRHRPGLDCGEVSQAGVLVAVRWVWQIGHWGAHRGPGEFLPGTSEDYRNWSKAWVSMA